MEALKPDGLRFGPLGESAVHICVDMQRLFAEDTPWRTPWMRRLCCREGDDVRLELPITLDEAVRGAKVKVPTVDGPVMLTVAPGSGSGKVLRLKGKGFSRKDGGRGDQLVTLEIELPDDLSELSGRLDGWSDRSNPRNRLGV